jgi:hypothetical protein
MTNDYIGARNATPVEQVIQGVLDHLRALGTGGAAGDLELAPLAALKLPVDAPTKTNAGKTALETLLDWLNVRLAHLYAQCLAETTIPLTRARQLLFFEAYYVGGRKRSEICNELGKPCLYPHDAAVISALGKRAKPTRLLPVPAGAEATGAMTERSVTNYVKEGANLVFGLSAISGRIESVRRRSTVSKPHTACAVAEPALTLPRPDADQPTAESARQTITTAPLLAISAVEPPNTPELDLSALEHQVAQLVMDWPSVWLWSEVIIAQLLEKDVVSVSAALDRLVHAGALADHSHVLGRRLLSVVAHSDARSTLSTDAQRALLRRVAALPTDAIDRFGGLVGAHGAIDLNQMLHGTPTEFVRHVGIRQSAFTGEFIIQQRVEATLVSKFSAFTGAIALIRRYGNVDAVIAWHERARKPLMLDSLPIVAELARRGRIWAPATFAACVGVAALLAGVLWAALTALRNGPALLNVLMVVAIAPTLAMVVCGVIYARLREAWVRVLWEIGMTGR